MYPSSIHVYLFLSLVYSPLSPSISLSIQIHGYLFQSVFFISVYYRIFTYIYFFLFSIHLYFFIPLCQSRLMPTSFYIFVDPNSRLFFSIPFSLFLSIVVYSPIFVSISFLSTSISLYLFVINILCTK